MQENREEDKRRCERSTNIARRQGYKIKITRQIESYHVTHNGVKPLNPVRRANLRPRGSKPRPLKAERGHSCIWSSYSIHDNTMG
jgi:hypothetical protein